MVSAFCWWWPFGCQMTYDHRKLRSDRRYPYWDIKGSNPWLVCCEHCNENFVLVSSDMPRPVGCVAPFDAPPLAMIWCDEKAQRTLRDIKGEALGLVSTPVR